MAEPTEGAYWIVCVGSQKALDIYGDSDDKKKDVIQNQRNASDGQIWTLDKQGSSWQVLCSLTGKTLDVAGGKFSAGTNVWQYSDTNAASQRWAIATDGKTASFGGTTYNTYLIRPAGHTNLSLAPKSNGTANNVTIELATYSSSSNFHRWILIPASILKTEGSYEIVLASDRKMCIDVAGASTANGANVQVAARTGAKSQVWRVDVNAETSLATFYNLKSNKVLDVKGGGTESGTNVDQYKYTNAASQRWLPVKSGSIKINGNTVPTYELRAQVGTNLTMDCKGGGKKAKTNIQVYTRNATVSQRFAFVKTEIGASDIAVPGAIQKTLFVRDGFGKVVLKGLKFSSKQKTFQCRFMVRSYKKGRKSYKSTRWQNFKDNSSARDGWGTAWSYTFKATPKLGLVTIPIKKTVKLDKTYQSADVYIDVRTFVGSYKNGFKAHGATKRTIIKIRSKPKITLKSNTFALADNGSTVGVKSIFTDSLGNGCVRLRTRLIGSDGIPISEWKSGTSMTMVHYLGKTLHRLPKNKESVTVEFVMLINDGITLKGVRKRNFDFGTLVNQGAPTFKYRNDGSYMLEITAPAHKNDACLMRVATIDGTKNVPCKLIKNKNNKKTWLALPPLNTAVTFVVYGYRNKASWYYSASKTKKIKSHTFIWNWTLPGEKTPYQNFASVFINNENPPEQTRNFSNKSSLQQPAGRVWPVAFAPLSLGADLSVSGVAIDSGVKYQAAGPIPPHTSIAYLKQLITLSTKGIHPMYRTPYGDWYQVVVEGLDISKKELYYSNVSVTQHAVED